MIQSAQDIQGTRSAKPDARHLWALRSGVTIATALLVAGFIRLISQGWIAAHYPYDLDYGEGIVWQQMLNIVSGLGYTPINVFPAIVYHYPPVYHVTVHVAVWLFGSDPLATGRTVSLLSTLVSIGLVGGLSYAAMPLDRSRRARLLAALIAGGCVAISPTIVDWAILMRVDMLAGALSLAGLVLTTGFTLRSARIALAALCFALAVYTKQTSIAAPVTAFVVLWLARPRAAWMLFAWCGGVGLCALAGLSLMSHGGFLRHTLLYNLNRIDLSRAQILSHVMLGQVSGMVIALLGVAATWRRLRPLAFRALRTKLASERRDFAACLLLVFLIIKTAMLPTVLKSGANDNYLIEWLYAVAAFVGIGALPVIDTALTGKRWPNALLVAMVAVSVPIQAGCALATGTRYPMLTTQYTEVVARITRARRPVVSDAMVVLIRGGQPVRWEPAIAAELGHGGLYNEAAFARLVRMGHFAFFVTEGDRGQSLYKERYNPVVADAIDATYPRREWHGNLVLHLPR